MVLLSFGEVVAQADVNGSGARLIGLIFVFDKSAVHTALDFHRGEDALVPNVPVLSIERLLVSLVSHAASSPSLPMKGSEMVTPQNGQLLKRKPFGYFSQMMPK